MVTLKNSLSGDVYNLAPMLLGWRLVRAIKSKTLVGRIVETEAYDESDAASHSYRGRTPRADVMFGPPGRAYVYFTYGMHHCFNVVTGNAGQGAAVLIRAVEPIQGIEEMKINRGTNELTNLTNGPAKLCQAFGLNKTFNGHDLSKMPLLLEPGNKTATDEIVTSTRIGITKDSYRLWRFYIKDNAYVSRVMLR